MAAAGVPVAAGMAIGERPAVLALAGVLVALPGSCCTSGSARSSGPD